MLPPRVAPAALLLFPLRLRVLVLLAGGLQALVDALLELVDGASERAPQLGQLAPAEEHESDDENDDEFLTPQSKHGRPPPREIDSCVRAPNSGGRSARGGERGGRGRGRSPVGSQSW